MSKYMTIFERAEKMTQTLRDIIGHPFDGERVELYIQTELADYLAQENKKYFKESE